MAETRIRWERTGYGWKSSVGDIDGWPFEIWGAANAPAAWRLKSHLPGQQQRRPHRDDPDELKAEAEGWLAEFASSLGAIIPDRHEISLIMMGLSYLEEESLTEDGKIARARLAFKLGTVAKDLLLPSLAGDSSNEKEGS